MLCPRSAMTALVAEMAAVPLKSSVCTRRWQFLARSDAGQHRQPHALRRLISQRPLQGVLSSATWQPIAYPSMPLATCAKCSCLHSSPDDSRARGLSGDAVHSHLRSWPPGKHVAQQRHRRQLRSLHTGREVFTGTCGGKGGSGGLFGGGRGDGGGSGSGGGQAGPPAAAPAAVAERASSEDVIMLDVAGQAQPSPSDTHRFVRARSSFAVGSMLSAAVTCGKRNSK